MNNLRTPLMIVGLAIATQAQAQVALSSSFALGVYADSNQLDNHSTQDTFFQSQGATLNSFSGSISVQDFDNTHSGRSLITRSSASASWADAGHGVVGWRDMGWTHNTSAQSGAKLNGFVNNLPVWSYTFLATDNGTFSVAYDVRGSGNLFGLLGAQIHWSGPGGDLNIQNPYNPAAVGTFVRNISAGNTYTVGLFNMGNIFTSLDPRTDSASLNADFNWSVNPVPEPSTVAGLAMFLLLFRKRAVRR